MQSLGKWCTQPDVQGLERWASLELRYHEEKGYINERIAMSTRDPINKYWFCLTIVSGKQPIGDMIGSMKQGSFVLVYQIVNVS
jgi:hypothetical protein